MFVRTNFKYLPLMVAFHILLWIFMVIGTYDEISVGPFIINISSLFIPFWFFIGNIVAEVYGYKHFKRLVLYSFIFQSLIVSSIFIVISSIRDRLFNFEFTEAQQQVIHLLPKVMVVNLLALICLWMINNFIIKKIKFILDERYFTLRGSGISIIGELSFIVVVNCAALYGIFAISVITKIIISAFLFYLIINICMIFPSNIIVKLLKNIEYQELKDEDRYESIFDKIYKNAKFIKDP